ncbi:hypothetical protein GGR56DRAFT_649221 [Xylariaceae sp. FL0804]|nr:hypothetical protein GGR56DRAFT_649221 [Xylariaceae sp. FL0804]
MLGIRTLGCRERRPLQFNASASYRLSCALGLRIPLRRCFTMSAADPYRSSPPPSAQVDPYSVESSSPTLPAIEEVFAKNFKKATLRSGNNVASIPADARTTFTSAASLLRDAPEIDLDTEQITKTPPRKSKPTRGRRKQAPVPEVAPLENEQVPIVIGSSSPGDKPWQKFKNKTSVAKEISATKEKQPALSKGRVTKATAVKQKRATGETVSRHFPVKNDKAMPREESVPVPDDKATLREESAASNSMEGRLDDPGMIATASPSEPAMARRMDWTPPRNNTGGVLGSDPDTHEPLSSVGKGDTSKEVFQTLFDQYGKKYAAPSNEERQQPQAEFLKKRKLLELISTSRDADDEHTREASPSKGLADAKEVEGAKKPKKARAPAPKKMRTITEIATAPFMLPAEPETELAGPSTHDSLLNYFDTDGAVKALVEHQSLVMTQKKGKGKATKQPAKPRRKRKTGTEDNPILLSPNSALKQTTNQDFVFGTSSQLVREDSPTTLRDLQLAIHASNQVDSDPFVEPDAQGLWHAGARDEDGHLMELELTDLQENRSIPQTTVADQQPADAAEFLDIEDIPDSPVVQNPLRKSPVPIELENSNSVPPLAAAQPSISSRGSGSENSSGETPISPRPKYELFTDAQLAKQITSYGFKPVKRRQAMIALLDQCWASRHQAASHNQMQQFSTSAHLESPPKKGPKATSVPRQAPKPRGRPRKNSVTDSRAEGSVVSEAPSPPKSRGRPRKNSDTNIRPESRVVNEAPSPSRSRGRPKKQKGKAEPELPSPKKPRGRPKKATKTAEVADSDVDEDLSVSPASSAERVFSSPPPMDLSATDEGDLSLAMSPTDQQTHLFKHISKAVISAPRSRDPSNPSWHEKMLLYDPIVLEDLASWLNAGELTRVGYDEEVSPSDVKKWCESKSVICLWRQNLNGKERKRY